MSSSNNPANPPPATSSPNPTQSPTSINQLRSSNNIAQSPVSKFAFFSKLVGIFKKASKKLIIWFVFTVIVGLLPIVASGFLGNFDHKLNDPFSLFIHGELLIISFALSADAMGDLFNANKLSNIFGIILFGVCFILFAFSGLIFAGLGIMETTIDKQEVGLFSLYMLGATFLASMGCKILTEV